jgi:HAD superfamily hydrolase (TIGR01549 family)
MVSAAVFDLDGTLVCLPIDWETLFDEFKKIINADAVRPLVDTVSRLEGQTRLEVFAAWDRAELAVAKSITANREGMALYLAYADKPRALVTLQGKKIVEVILREFGLSFDVVITREDSLNRTEQLHAAAEKLKVPVEEIFFVGNADTDAAAAQNVGCRFQRVK